jgi:hypothetical protein
MEPGTLFEKLTAHLNRAAGEVEERVLHALRTLVWLIATIACAVLAVTFSVTALIVSMWDTQHLLPLIVPAITCALLAALFAWFAARSHKAHAATDSGALTRAGATADMGGAAHRHGHPLAWLVALAGLLYLGPSREFLALAVRLRGVLALLGQASYLAQRFARRRPGDARSH